MSGTAGAAAAAEAAARADGHAGTLPPGRRKHAGAWFTPPALAQPTAARALAPLLATGDAARLRIVDPAVGGGAFLRAALPLLVEAGVPAPAAARCLYGVDRDATAAALAAQALTAASGADAAAVAARVHAGDGLCDLEDGSFDAVLTNPPWQTLHGAAARTSAAALRGRFVHQGRGKRFTYRLFVERAIALLRPGGRLGLVVPASLWFDRDAEPLRRLLLDTCDWQWLFGFENRRRVFSIDGRYRFAVVVATKGGATTAVRVAFGRTDVREWAAAAPPHVVYGRDELRALSPGSGAFVEVADRRDLEVLRRMHQGGVPLLGAGSAFAWRQGDYNMTADRSRFVPRSAAEEDGHDAGADHVWRCKGHADLLPLYQGAMIGDLHPNAGAHAGGRGRRSRWTPTTATGVLQPAYLVDAPAWRAASPSRSPVRLVHRALSNASNARTLLCCLLPDLPCGNSLGVLSPTTIDRPLGTTAAAAAVLSSLAFDWALRQRLGGTNLNAFVLADCVLPRLGEATARELARAALRLCALLPAHGELLRLAAAEGLGADLRPALDPAERGTLATRIDVLAGAAYGLDARDVAWIVRGCDLPVVPRGRTPPDLPVRGFWRLDRDLPPAARRPNRWLAALGAVQR